MISRWWVWGSFLLNGFVLILTLIHQDMLAMLLMAVSMLLGSSLQLLKVASNDTLKH